MYARDLLLLLAVATDCAVLSHVAATASPLFVLPRVTSILLSAGHPSRERAAPAPEEREFFLIQLLGHLEVFEAVAGKASALLGGRVGGLLLS